MIRRGFTLVELLIVIVVIGILAAMMMLSATEAITTAKASKIVSDMRSLNTALLAWYMDNLDKFELENKAKPNGYMININGKQYQIHDYLKSHKTDFTRYINGKVDKLNENINWSKQTFAAEGGYSVYMGNANTVCYIVYGVPKDSRLRNKLTSSTKSAGLLGYTYGSKTSKYPSKSYEYDNDGLFVCGCILA